MKNMFFICLLLFGCANHQQRIKSELYLTEDTNIKVGTVWFKDTANGLLIEVKLKNLPQGEHGFHVHENPDCSSTNSKSGKVEYASRAGGHFDPYKTGKHLGPNGGGHLGDLPYLSVNAHGEVTRNFYLKDIKAEDFKNRSLMIHYGGDNYKDIPLPLGGGGARIACGIIE